jgi:hypothetical protein
MAANTTGEEVPSEVLMGERVKAADADIKTLLGILSIHERYPFLDAEQAQGLRDWAAETAEARERVAARIFDIEFALASSGGSELHYYAQPDLFLLVEPMALIGISKLTGSESEHPI